MKVLGVGLSIHHNSQLCVSYVDYCKLILSVGCHVRDVTLSHTLPYQPLEWMDDRI